MATLERRATEPIYQLKITLRGIRPPIWRRIQVPGNLNLHNFHELIQVVMGWQNCHLYTFEVGGTEYGDPHVDWEMDIKNAMRIRLSQVGDSEKTEFSYTYDMGDNWEHEVVVEKVLTPEPGKHYPICLAGERACPPENCGGIWSYEELLETIRDPEHESYEEMMDWLGGEFDPEAFDMERVNRSFALVR